MTTSLLAQLCDPRTPFGVLKLPAIGGEAQYQRLLGDPHDAAQPFRDFVADPESVIINAEAAGRWYSYLPVNDVPWDAFGEIHAPSGRFWIEWVMPSRRFSAGQWRDLGCERRMGALCRLVEDPPCGIDGHATLYISDLFIETTPLVTLAMVQILLHLDNHRVARLVDLDDDRDGFVPCRTLNLISDASRIGPEVARDLADEPAKVVAYALSLMACKNITLATEIEEHRQPRKARRPRNVPPRIEWRRIVLPAKPGTHHAGSGKPGDPQPHHLVRGHFKTYTPEAPLLGKHVGTYWWGWQARGNKEHGERKHVYDLSGAA